MLGVHDHCLCWRKMKEEGIEILDLIKNSEPFTRDLLSCRRILIVIVGDIEARERDFTDSIFRLNQILPILAQIPGVGILARHPYNGDGLRADVRFSCRAFAAGLLCLACTGISCQDRLFTSRVCLWFSRVGVALLRFAAR